VSRRARMTDKGKRVWTGIGIAVGTVALFCVSFVTAFSLIVNPLPFPTIGDSDIEKENKELKAQIESLKEDLEKAEKKAQSSKKKETAEKEEKKEEKTEEKTSEENSNESTKSPSESEQSKAPENKPEEKPSEPQEPEVEFTPETVTTPQGGNAVEPEDDITVIDISE